MKLFLFLMMISASSLVARPYQELFTIDEIEVSQQGFWVHFDDCSILCDSITHWGYGYYRIGEPDYGICSDCGAPREGKGSCSNQECHLYRRKGSCTNEECPRHIPGIG